MDVTQHTVTLSDGRHLEVQVGGAPEGPAVVAHHGTPGSALALGVLEDAATERGLRLLCPTRAGYGGSTRDEGREVGAVAPDSAELLDALGVVRFATIGWSGGGPHALACAALLPERCAAAISLAGVAPYLPDAFDWTAGMDEENVKEFELALEAGPAYDEMLATARDAMLAFTPTATSTMRDLFGGLASDRDSDGTTPADVAWLHGIVAAGLARGVGGWRDDDQAFVHDWGFDVREVEVPVGVWYGDQDRMVPTRHGEWLAANVKGAVGNLMAGEGHLTLVLDRPGEILDGLVALAGGAW